MYLCEQIVILQPFKNGLSFDFLIKETKKVELFVISFKIAVISILKLSSDKFFFYKQFYYDINIELQKNIVFINKQ